MAIKVKAVERNVSFDKTKEKWAYVMQADLYNKLSQSKVINEASLRSGITRGSINAAWDAIGEVIKAWATEGHSVAIPGLGSMRFGLRASSVTDVNKVGANLITSRRVIFVPNTEIKDELAKTSINITCYDRNGEVVKRVTSSDDGNVEDPENENQNENGGGSNGSNSGSSGSTENVFIDSERETWNMDPELLEVAIKDRIAKTGKKPKAIVPVALYGMPYKIDRIMEIADKYGIPVVEDAAEGFGSKFKGQVLGTFGKYGVLSFNGNKMITTSGGGALITENEDEWREIMMYATQYRESYPYYQHEKIGYNYRMSNICAGIGCGQMTVAAEHIEHHKHVQKLYEELLKDVKGVTVHSQPEEWSMVNGQCSMVNGQRSMVYDSNYWLCTITLDPDLKIKGQENAYKTIVKGAVGGAAGVIHAAESATTDCQPNENVEALRVFMDQAQIEARPVWKPMHKQPVYEGRRLMDDVRCEGYHVVTTDKSISYINGVSEEIFKIGMCLPAGPYVSDDDVKYIVETIKDAIA